MVAPKLALVFDRRHVATLQKEAPVEIRITYRYRQVYIPTGVHIKKEQWKEGKVVASKDELALNKKIIDIQSRVIGIIENMVREGNIDINVIPRLLRTHTDNMTFIQYVEKRAAERPVRESTRKRYYCFLRFLKEWRGIVYFGDVTETAVRTMNETLARRHLMDSTIRSYNKYLHLFIADAVTDGYLKSNPYATGRIKVPRGEKGQIECLEEWQVEKLRKLKLQDNFLSRTRDVFLFQCYTGLAYSDLKAFDITKFKRNKNGLLCGDGRRIKTNSPYTLCILPEAEEILKKYGGKLPVISNQKYNYYLKIIGAHIDCPHLHTHMGRSTFATMMLNKGVSIDILRHIVGHEDRSQTERYATMRRESIMNAFQEICDRKNGKKRRTVH